MTRLTIRCAVFALALHVADALGADQPFHLMRDGAFGFAQKDAKVVCDDAELRVSIWNDAGFLYVQAILWKDGDDALGETRDGRPIGDNSTLDIDADANGKATPQVDRNYSLNAWPSRPGLSYSVRVAENSTTGLQSDSKGRGAIRYLTDENGKKARVDSYVIPLKEIRRRPGDHVRLAYYGSSTKPEFVTDSIGYRAKGTYYPHNLPIAKYHDYALEARPASLELTAVPEGREDPCPLPKKDVKPIPAIGSVPPEFGAQDWLNSEAKLTRDGLRGKVVLVDFWATWCGPCMAGVPHLNALQASYGAKGLVVVGLTDQSRKGIEDVVKAKPMKYAIGSGSEAAPEYGITAIPHVFLIGKDGKLLWEGSPSDAGLEARIGKALEAK